MSISPRLSRKTSVSSSMEIPSPRRKTKGKSKNSSKKDYPFMHEDEFSDINIVIDGKQLYTNRCLLAYNSSILKDRFLGENDEGGRSPRKGKDKKGPSSSASKDLDLSDWSYDVIVNMLTQIDPRCEETLTDKAAIEILPFVEEYKLKRLKNECERTLTTSYAAMRKGRRCGMVSTDVTLEYLSAADTYDMEELKAMCIEECVHNDNPYSNKTISDAEGISERAKFQIVSRKYEKVHYTLVKERRDRSTKEESKGSNLWRK